MTNVSAVLKNKKRYIPLQFKLEQCFHSMNSNMMISGIFLWPFAQQFLFGLFPISSVYMYGRDLYSYKRKPQVSTNKEHASESITPCRMLFSYQTQTEGFHIEILLIGYSFKTLHKSSHPDTFGSIMCLILRSSNEIQRCS